MKVVIIKDSKQVKVNGKYQPRYYPTLFEDKDDDSGRWIASFKSIEDALEYIQFKGFDIGHTDYKD